MVRIYIVSYFDGHERSVILASTNEVVAQQIAARLGDAGSVQLVWLVEPDQDDE